MTIDPSEIGKHPDLIKRAQAEMAQSDVLVCGKCHAVFHFVDLFKEHKEGNCKQVSSLKDSRETKPKVWAFLLWKASQLNVDENANVNAWKLYQTWIKLDESVRETWLVAGRTIQSFARFGNGSLQEMPVKITRTIVESPEKKVLTPNTQQNAAKRVVPVPKSTTQPESKIIKTIVRSNDNSSMLDAEEELSKIKENQIIRKVETTQASSAKPTILADKVLNRTAIRTLPTGNETEEHDIEKILAKRFNPKKKGHEYLIKWSNLPQSANTWEPVKHIEDCKDLLDIFETQLAKQKEQRAKAAGATTTTTINNQQSPSMVTSTPNRPIRISKTKAMDQVKQWVSSSHVQQEEKEQAGKRKLQDSDVEFEMEADDSMEDRKNKSDPVVKRIRSDNPAVNDALMRAGSTGNVRIMPVPKTIISPNYSQAKQTTINGGTTIKKVITKSSSSDVIITKDQKQQSGVFKKTTLQPILPKPTEGQVKIIDKNDSMSSGIVRISSVSSPKPTTSTLTPSPGTTKNTVTRFVSTKPSSPNTQTIVRTVQQTVPKPITPVTKQVVQKIVQKPGQVSSPNVRVQQKVSTPVMRSVQQTQQVVQKRIISPGQTTTTSTSGGITTIRRTVPAQKSTPVQQTIQRKVVPSPQQSQSGSGVKIVRKVLPPSAAQKTPTIVRRKIPDDDDDGIPDPFPKDLPPITEPPSPPRPLTLCPITGEVLGKAEGESSPVPDVEDDTKPVSAPPGKAIIRPKAAPEKVVEAKEEIEQEIPLEAQQIQQFLTNEDGSPIFITGDDGTIYQVAGKNANGETVLLTQGADGEQTCVLLPADQDFLGLSMATEEGVAGETMTVDSAVAEAVALGELKEASEGGDSQDGTGDATQPLSVQIATTDSDSQDGQITAEIVQADHPSPGGTRKVVLLLPDGSLMMTDVSDEQFQSLNIQN